MDHPTTEVECEGDDTHILEEAIKTVYDRPDTHGEPEDSFDRIAVMWEAYLDTTVSAADVANLMVLLKVARNAEGHYHEDNYTDIAGYAENGARLHDADS
jgi:hypothetical protein